MTILIIVISLIVHLASIKWAIYEINYTYKNGGLKGLKPDEMDVIIVFIPVVNLLTAIMLFLIRHIKPEMVFSVK